MFSKEFKDAYFSALALPEANPDDKEDWPVKVTDTHEVSSKCLERAWETAHRIREFEIQLYWKRALYFWGFQAAFFAVVVSVGLKLNSTELYTTTITIIALLSISAVVLSIMWLLMSKGAKFWQENWENQVDLLEEHICGNLYKVYPIREVRSSKPFSVTKLNMAVIRFITFIWLFVSVVSLRVLIKDVWPHAIEKLGSWHVPYFFFSISFIGVTLIVFLLLAVSSLRSLGSLGSLGSLRMSGFDDPVFPKNNEGNGKESIYSRTKS